MKDSNHNITACPNDVSLLGASGYFNPSRYVCYIFIFIHLYLTSLYVYKILDILENSITEYRYYRMPFSINTILIKKFIFHLIWLYLLFKLIWILKAIFSFLVKKYQFKLRQNKNFWLTSTFCDILNLRKM